MSDPKQNGCRPTPTFFLLFPRLKIKLKGRHFDTDEVIEAVLNSLTEHDFQDAIKNGRRWWWPVHTMLVFNQLAAPVPEIMDDTLYIK
jgi:hypothetical protein